MMTLTSYKTSYREKKLLSKKLNGITIWYCDSLSRCDPGRKKQLLSYILVDTALETNTRQNTNVYHKKTNHHVTKLLPQFYIPVFWLSWQYTVAIAACNSHLHVFNHRSDAFRERKTSAHSSQPCLKWTWQKVSVLNWLHTSCQRPSEAGWVHRPLSITVSTWTRPHKIQSLGFTDGHMN